MQNNLIDYEPLGKVFKCPKFYMLCAMGFMFVWFPYMLTNLIKPYGVLYLEEIQIDRILLIFPLMNGPTRIIIGWLCDIYGFKKVYYSMIFTTVK